MVLNKMMPMQMYRLLSKVPAGNGTASAVDGRGPETATVQGAVGESRVSFQCCHVAAGNRQIVIRRS